MFNSHNFPVITLAPNNDSLLLKILPLISAYPVVMVIQPLSFTLLFVKVLPSATVTILLSEEDIIVLHLVH